MSELNNLGNIAKNTVISIFVIIGILCAVPSIFYVWSLINIGKEEILIKKFMNREIKVDMDRNTLSDLWLFSSYTPYKRNRRCDDYKPDDPEEIEYYKYLSDVNNIIEKFESIKKECDGLFYNDIKMNSDKKIQENKIIREAEEHDIRQRELENSPQDRTLIFNYVTYIADRFFSGGKFATNILFRIAMFFVPIVPSVIKSQVLMGFFILVFIIFMLLYFIKPKNKDYKIGSVSTGTSSGSSSGTSSWFSWFSGSSFSIWKEVDDTLKYYDNMMNTFSISDYTGMIFTTEDSIDGTNENSNIQDREKEGGGKIYDNLSYIMLSEVDLKPEQLKSYLSIDNIETGKYYNIYLPEEKFKMNDNPSIVKWKVENIINNEKKWKIDCEKMDKIKNKDGVSTNIPAFINDVKDNNKCVINVPMLNAGNIEKPKDSNVHIYTPERIT